MYRSSIGIVCLVLLSAIFVSATLVVEQGLSWAQGERLLLEAKEAKVIHVKGDVKVRKAATGEWVDATVGMIILKGDRVVTEEDASVEIGFGEGFKNAMRMDEFGEITLTAVEPTEIELMKGKLFSLVEELDPDEVFIIRTPVAVASARGTGWESGMVDNRAGFKSFEDEIFVQGILPDGRLMAEVVVQAGWKTTVERFERPSPLERVTRLELRTWRSFKRELRGHIRRFEREERRPSRIEEGMEQIEERFERKLEERSGAFEIDEIKKIEDRKATTGTTGAKGEEEEPYP